MIGSNLYIHDPHVNEKQIAEILNVDYSKGSFNDATWTFTRDLEVAFSDADAIIILTEWEEYLKINWNELSRLMRRPAWLFDTRGIIEYEAISDSVLNFWKIGKGIVREI